MADLYADHNIALPLVRLLRNRHHAVIAARDIGLDHARDDLHLLTAAERGWVLVTHDKADFELLHDAWRRWSQAWQVGRQHAGILVVPHWAPGQMAQEIDAFLQSGPPLANALYRRQSRPDGQWVLRL